MGDNHELTPLKEDDGGNRGGSSKNSIGWFEKLLSDLDLIELESNHDEDDFDSDKKEFDPFSRKRTACMYAASLLAVLVNLIIIPASLTKMEDKRMDPIEPSGSPSSTPTLSPIPTLAPSMWGAQTSSPATTNDGNYSNNSPSLPGAPLSPVYPGEPTVPQVPTLVTQNPYPAINFDLPPYTLDALNDYDTTRESPQSKALTWLMLDPALNQYSSTRQRQRLALATLFFSTNEPPYGPDPDIFSSLFDNHEEQVMYAQETVWVNATNWMSYDIHECLWFSQAQFSCDNEENYQYLVLAGNGLAGRVPAELAMLTHLEVIRLSENINLYGTIPSQLGDLSQLSALDLSGSPLLSGTIPSTLGNLHASLRIMNLRETPFLTKLLPTELGRLSRLTQLLLDTHINKGRGLTTRTGTLPTELGRLTSLQSFTISGDEVFGTLPPQLAELTFLQWLHIVDTQITGSIPQEYGYMPRLTILGLSHNQLAYTLPSTLGLLRDTLTTLEVNDNRLTGSIPIQYSNLTLAKVMSFQKNLLSGSVPLNLCYLRLANVMDVLRVDCLETRSLYYSDSYVECDCDCECF